MGNRQVVPVGSARGAQIAGLIDDCVAMYDALPFNSRQLSVNCYAILINIADSTAIRSPSDEPLYQNYVLPVIKEIERHYYMELTVDGLSGLVYITPQYLSRLFRRFLNCSTYEYLTSFRLSKAKELLITDVRLEVQEIARMTGFSDTSHFIAVFKKIAGVTPLEFRKLNRTV